MVESAKEGAEAVEGFEKAADDTGRSRAQVLAVGRDLLATGMDMKQAVEVSGALSMASTVLGEVLRGPCR